MAGRAVNEYLDLPYTISLTPNEDDDNHRGWIAEVFELPGCISQGDTPGDARASIRDAMASWISAALDDGTEIPRPGSTNIHEQIDERPQDQEHDSKTRASRFVFRDGDYDVVKPGENPPSMRPRARERAGRASRPNS